MKVLVTAEGDTAQASVCGRLARAPYFLIYDTQTEQWTSYANPYQQEHGMDLVSRSSLRRKAYRLYSARRRGQTRKPPSTP